MPEEREEWTLEVGQLVARVRRRWRIVALVGASGVLVALTASAIAPNHYESTASVAVLPIRLPGSTSVPDINIDTERTIMLSREVAIVAVRDLGGGVTATDLDDASSVAAPEGSDVLQVTVTAATPASAARRADALADAYLQFRSAGAIETARPSIDALNERIAATSKTDRSTLADLRAQRTAYEHVGDATGRVIGRAETPTAASSFGPLVYAAGGLVAGLLLGLCVALLRDLLDRRVRFASRFFELTRRTGLVVDGSSPEPTRWLLRALREDEHPGGPIVVGLFSDDASLTGRLLDSLRRHAPMLQHDVQVIDAAALAPGVLERTWHPDSADGAAPDSVLVDASRVVSGAQRAVIADSADAALLVAGARTRVAAVAELLRMLDDAGVQHVIPAFVTSTGSRAVVPVFIGTAGAPQAEPLHGAVSTVEGRRDGLAAPTL